MTGAKICPVCGGAYAADDLFCPRDRAPLVPAGDGASLEGTIVAERYLLTSLIGSGGMGDVYRAQDVRLQRPAAVKLLRTALTADLDALRRFSREGMNASRINHPHVVQVYDAGETSSGVPYLAMEFVAGKSLGRLLADEGPLPPARAAELLRQVAEGLDAAHRLGVVHRDLKLDNILVAGAGTAEETAKVVDFGISRTLRDETQKVTKSGYVAGTYEFMSPEQVLGGDFDHRSDLYSLALIAFMLLTGRLPFPGETAEHSMLMRLHEPPRSLHAMSPERDWPPALQEVFDRALSREPGQRFASAGEFAAALTNAALRRPAAGASAAASPARWRRLAWAAGATGVALVVAAAVILGSRWRSDDSTGSPVADASRSEEPAPPPDSGPAPDTAHAPIPAPNDSVPVDFAPPADSTPPVDPGTGAASPVPPSRPAPGTRHPGRSGGGGSIPDNGKGSANVDAPPSPPAPPNPGANARALLDPFEFILHTPMPADSARLALAALDSILPHLATARDSVDANLYRAEALEILGMEDQACQALDDVWPRASDLQRRKIRLWVDKGLCPGARWTET